MQCIPTTNKQMTQALVHVGRANRSGQLQRSGYQDEVPKTADKMMALMAIATSLAPGAKIDEQVSQVTQAVSEKVESEGQETSE